MSFRGTIELAGRVHAVEVAPAADGTIVVLVDDVATTLDVRRLPDGALSVRLADGSTHLLVVERGTGADQRVVAVDGHRIGTAVNGRRAGGGAGGAAAEGRQQVVAPMPGRIVRVLVAPGDTVEARQALVVVEAMKMENELSATRAGCVVEVLVDEGQSVEAGRLLVVVE